MAIEQVWRMVDEVRVENAHVPPETVLRDATVEVKQVRAEIASEHRRAEDRRAKPGE